MWLNQQSALTNDSVEHRRLYEVNRIRHIFFLFE